MFIYLFKSGSKVHKTHKTAWTHTMKTRQKETLKLNTAQQIDNIKMMSYKTCKNENFFGENEKMTCMIIIAKTISSCLYNRTVTCIFDDHMLDFLRNLI